MAFGTGRDTGYSGHTSFAEREEMNRREASGRGERVGERRGSEHDRGKERGAGSDRSEDDGSYRHVRVSRVPESEGGGYRTTTHEDDDSEPTNERDHESLDDVKDHLAEELGSEDEGSGGDGEEDSGNGPAGGALGDIAGTI